MSRNQKHYLLIKIAFVFCVWYLITMISNDALSGTATFSRPVITCSTVFPTGAFFTTTLVQSSPIVPVLEFFVYIKLSF